MPTSIFAAGTSKIETGGKEFGRGHVHVPGIKPEDLILLTPYTQNGGPSGPEGKGPLYCAFISDKSREAFEILVYDIQGGKFNVTVTVDWAVVRPS
jgi:hypothetical protein